MIPYRPRPRTTLVILHHSHSPPTVSRGEPYLRWHGRQMGLLDIGYHALSERDGTIVPTRDYASVGSHTPGYNHENVGVCLVGGWDDAGDPQQTPSLTAPSSPYSPRERLRDRFAGAVPAVFGRDPKAGRSIARLSSPAATWP